MDLTAIESYYEQGQRGYPPYHPGMMSKILVYGFRVGVFWSRRLRQRLQEDVAFRVLAGGNEPDFRTISDFRRIHLETLEGLFQQVLRMALELGRVAMDGSKLKANPSKHKAMSYQRMKEQEQRLREEVRRLLQSFEATEVEEDMPAEQR